MTISPIRWSSGTPKRSVARSGARSFQGQARQGQARPGVRRRHYRRGKLAEALSRWWLRLKGYRIIVANKRLKSGEVDIIAAKGDVLVFVEVKLRGSGSSLEVLAPGQKRRLLRSAAGFAARYQNPEACVRFDLILWRGWRPPLHIRDAWRDGD